MLKFVLIAVALFFLFKMFKGDSKHKETVSKKERDRLIASGEMIKDPVCGTYVDKDSDIRVREGEKVHCFCSFECRDKFIKQLQAGDEE